MEFLYPPLFWLPVPPTPTQPNPSLHYTVFVFTNSTISTSPKQEITSLNSPIKLSLYLFSCSLCNSYRTLYPYTFPPLFVFGDWEYKLSLFPNTTSVIPYLSANWNVVNSIIQMTTNNDDVSQKCRDHCILFLWFNCFKAWPELYFQLKLKLKWENLK